MAAVSVLLDGRFQVTVDVCLFTLMSRTSAAAISISRQMNHDPRMHIEKGSTAWPSVAEVQVPRSAGNSQFLFQAFRVGKNSKVIACFCVAAASPLRMLRMAALMDLRTSVEMG